MKVYIPYHSAVYEELEEGPHFITRELAEEWIRRNKEDWERMVWKVCEEEVHESLP